MAARGGLDLEGAGPQEATVPEDLGGPDLSPEAAVQLKDRGEGLGQSREEEGQEAKRPHPNTSPQGVGALGRT